MRNPDVEGKAGKVVGRNLALSLPRRIMCDLLAFAKAIPTVPVQRRMNLAGVVAARARLAPDAPGWVALFTKAYALTAERHPELRRAYLSFPRPHLYEHPFSIASIAVERQYEGENAVFWGHLRRPELHSLRELHAQLRRFKDEPLRNFGLIRRMLMVGRLPWPLRRLAWWLGLNFSGRKRAGYMGTFGISVYSGLGAESLHPISPLTTTMNYGTIAADGGVTVRIVYDHRVMDGATIARALACLEGVLNREIVAELEQDAQARAA
jgi:pyruvate/2-oxoglutarate dehydrogenase complex dihydrolipoamide acyltransferase (E2) component